MYTFQGLCRLEQERGPPQASSVLWYVLTEVIFHYSAILDHSLQLLLQDNPRPRSRW